MPKFSVAGTVTISLHTVVEAETEEEAWELAKYRPIARLCHHCTSSRDDDKKWCTSGIDGDDITYVEALELEGGE